jgi:hypothetical protein
MRWPLAVHNFATDPFFISFYEYMIYRSRKTKREREWWELMSPSQLGGRRGQDPNKTTAKNSRPLPIYSFFAKDISKPSACSVLYIVQALEV